MNFQVEWERGAEQQLIELWLNAADRKEITNAADEIEALLAKAGSDAGESRSGTLRILIHLPLACYFHVQEANRTVVVSQIWRKEV